MFSRCGFVCSGLWAVWLGFVSELVLMTGGLGFGCKVVPVMCNGFGFDW